MKCNPHILISAARRGFTLVELLTVIAIIGVLAAIIIPVIGKTRESARGATSLSNLHQIGLACLTFAAENKNRLPAGQYDGGNKDWSITLELWHSWDATKTKSAIIWDPTTTWNPSTPMPRSYVGNSLALIRNDGATTAPGLPLNNVGRPSQTALVMTGAMSTEGGSCGAITAWDLFGSDFTSSSKSTTPLDSGLFAEDNSSDAAGWQTKISARHGNKTKVQMVMADASAKVVKKTEMIYGMVAVAY